MKKLKSLVLGLALVVLSVSKLDAADCGYPTICARIPCYFSDPAIAASLTMQQVYDFTWYYMTFCWFWQ